MMFGTTQKQMNCSNCGLQKYCFQKRTEDLSKLEPITLDGRWKKGYKRQMDMYNGFLREKTKEDLQDYQVSNIGYFVYVNGDQHFLKKGC